MDALEPVPFRLLIDRVVAVARPHFAAAFLATALPVAAASVLFAFLQHRMISGLATADPAMLFFAGGYVFSIFVLMLAFIAAYSALAIAAAETFDGGEIHIGRAWRRLFVPRVLWTVFLWSVVGFVSVLLCIAPAVIVIPLLAFTLNVMVAEERYGLDALKRSAELVWSSPTGKPVDSVFVRVAAIFLVGWGVQSGVGLITQGPFVVLQQYYSLRDAAGGVGDSTAAFGPLWVQIGGQFFSAITTAVGWFYWAFAFPMLYYELRRRREGGDLRRAVDTLTNPGTNLAPSPVGAQPPPAPPLPSTP
ncbi:MAG: hypothetical protein AAFY88_11030 [Acidobacteriota bacterium]